MFSDATFHTQFTNWLKAELNLRMEKFNSDEKELVYQKSCEYLKNQALKKDVENVFDSILGTNNIVQTLDSITACRSDFLKKQVMQKSFSIDIQILSFIEYQKQWKKIASILHQDGKVSTIKYHGNNIIAHKCSIFYFTKHIISYDIQQNQNKLLEYYDELQNLKKHIKTLEEENLRLKHEIILMKEDSKTKDQKIQTLQQHNTELLQDIQTTKEENILLKKEPEFEGKSIAYKTCYLLWKQAEENETRPVHNKTYIEDLKPIFVIFSMFGKKVYAFAYQTLGFPSFITTMTYKKELANYHFGSALEDKLIFNGEISNLKTLIDCFLPENRTENESKGVLVVDAASIRANISINEKGVVTGLKEKLVLSEEETNVLLNDEKKFRQFCIEKLDNAVRAIFVILYAPLDPTLKAFPICEITALNGSANDEITDKMKQIRKELEELKIKVIGFGNDGDKHYLKAAKEFLEIAVRSFQEQTDQTLSECFEEFMETLVFYDPLHNGKNNRYFLSDPEFLFFWVDEESTKYNVDDLKAIIDPNLLSTSEITKMDDNLALKLFSEKNIHSCIQNKRMDLAFALLPTTLLFQAIFKEELSRAERIRRLSIGFALILLYAYDSKQHLIEKGYTQREYKDRNKHRGSRIWPSTFCGKYLEMIFGTVKVLCENTKIHMGSLGSHLIEHWFGLIRKLTQQNYELSAFFDATRKTILYNTLCSELGVNTKIEKRMSDSGVKIMQENEELDLRPLGYYICIAYKIAKECGMPIFEAGNVIDIIQKYEKDVEYSSLTDLFPTIDMKKPNKTMSMRKDGFGKAPGAVQYGTHRANTQLQKLAIKPVKPKRKNRSLKGKSINGVPEAK